MSAVLRPLGIALGLCLPITAQRFLPVDQTPIVGHPLERSVHLLCGDVDGDGDIDMVHRHGSVVRNTGGRRFVASAPGTDIPFRPVPFPATAPAIALADLDADGVLDVLSHDYTTALFGTLEVMRGRGDGTFLPSLTAGATGLYFGLPTAVRDFDGDGLPDVFVRGFGGSRLMRNFGGASFADVSSTTLPLALQNDSFTPLDFADIDRDGDLDMVTLRGSANEIWRNNSLGVFSADPANNLAAFGSFTRALFFDQDQDRDADLLLLDETSGTVRLLIGNAGLFAASPLVFASSSPVVRMAVGDVDRDSVPDVVVLAGTAPNAEILSFGNRITSMPLLGTVSASRSPIVDSSARMDLVDLDLDGDLDLVLDSEGMFLGDGTGGFRPWTRSATPLLASGVTTLAEDVDTDGDLDLLAGAQVLLQDGDGRFTSAASTLPGDAVARALVDLDLDGDRDLVYTSANPQSTDPQACGFALRAGGTFAPTPFSTAVVRGEVAVADFDADGLPDLVAGDGSILRNLAGTSFVAGPRLQTNVPVPVVAADFDSDGLVDVVLGTERFRNLGSMTFASQGRLPLQTPSTPCHDLATADLDNDGDADLALRTDPSVGGDTMIYLQSPLGLQVGFGTFDPSLSAHLTVVLADVDSDGLVDVVDGAVWKNLGGGVFTRLETLPSLPDDRLASQWVAADFDRDGDVDLAAGFSDHVQVLANRRRQVRSPRVPTLGDPYEVEFAVEAGWSNVPGFVLPLLALQRRTPPIPSPFGLLHVDPATSFVGPVLTTNPSGTATLSFVVPNDPALDGLDFYWQALGQQGPSLRLTNVWREHIAR